MEWLYTGVTGRLQIAGHRVIDRWARRYQDETLLEVGCGRGHHLLHASGRLPRYVGLEVEFEFIQALQKRLPGTRAVNGDAYALPFLDTSVDCVLSVYCFEHLRNLPACLAEIRRVLKPGGELLVGLPAEGGLLYGIGRSLTSKRYMEAKYGIDYDAIVKWEHCNTSVEVLDAVAREFDRVECRFLPFRWLPTVHVNAIVCARYRRR